MVTIASKNGSKNQNIGASVIKVFREEHELSTLAVNGIGFIEIMNTGGSSAAEGGMGDRGGSEKGPGILQTDGETKTNETGNESFDKKFDPLAPKEDKTKDSD